MFFKVAPYQESAAVAPIYGHLDLVRNTLQVARVVMRAGYSGSYGGASKGFTNYVHWLEGRFVVSASRRTYSIATPLSYEIIRDAQSVSIWNRSSQVSEEDISLLIEKLADVQDCETVAEATEYLLLAIPVGTAAHDLICALIGFDFGYLRVDNDPERQDGDRHPLDHIDLNYSNASKVKIGLTSQPKAWEVAHLLSQNHDCWYLIDGRPK